MLKVNKYIFLGAVLGSAVFMVVISAILITNKNKHEADKNKTIV